MLTDLITPTHMDRIDGYRLYMRPMLPRDGEAWIALRATSRDHLEPWEPTWTHDSLTKDAYRRRMRFFQKTAKEDSCYAYLIFHATSQKLMGGITMNNVRRGVTHSASLGYWIGTPFLNQGYMTEAVVAMTTHAFEVMRLNRLEAACLPHNEPSAQVLLKAGYTEEGFARGYRMINGKWQDHRLFGIVAGDTTPTLVSIAKGRS